MPRSRLRPATRARGHSRAKTTTAPSSAAARRAAASSHNAPSKASATRTADGPADTSARRATPPCVAAATIAHPPVCAPAATAARPAAATARAASMPSTRCSGTITKLINGTAIMLASGPTSEACPKNQNVSGSSASAISRGARPTFVQERRANPRPRACRHSQQRDADERQPETRRQHRQRIEQQDRAQCQRQRLRADCCRAGSNAREATAPIIHNVRMVGRPKPASAP